MVDLDQWNATTHGTSLLVLVHGRIVHEWYADGLASDDAFLGASMTKSALAHLVGIALRSGTLEHPREGATRVRRLVREHGELAARGDIEQPTGDVRDRDRGLHDQRAHDLLATAARRGVHDALAVRCEARVIHVGSRVATAEGRVVDRRGKLYAHATATCILVEHATPARRRG